MKTARLFFAIVGAAVTGGGVAGMGPVTPARPNIVVILADDLGWADLGAYGQTFAETPHLDRLAREGVRFTQGYAPAPICSASRAAILTGRSPARLHFEFVTKEPGAKGPKNAGLRQPAFPVNLPLEEISLAEALAPAGYATGFFGKWHLTQENDRYLGHGEKFGPKQQGFAVTSEERGSHPYNYPGGRKNPPPPGEYAPGEFAPDALTDQTVAFLRAQTPDRPFLLFFSQYYVHDPVHTRVAWLLEKYRAKAARTGRIATDEQLSYAALVETMDHQAGRVLAALDELGFTANTLVIFLSDNGGHPDFATIHLRGSKWTLYEGGTRVPFLARWPQKIARGRTSDVPVIGTDLLPTLCGVAGVAPPADRSIDGVDLRGLLTAESTALAREALSWHFPFYHAEFVGTKPVSSLRRGHEKLLYFYEDERVELYDLADDPLEERNLASAQPARAAQLKAELLATLSAEGARFPGRGTQK